MAKDKNTESLPERVCPSCGLAYRAHPAVSRADNATLICPDCGIRESLASLGCSVEEQEHILGLIQASVGGGENG